MAKTVTEMRDEELQKIARKHAAESNHPYTVDAADHKEDWQAHEWVITAMREAYQRGLGQSLRSVMLECAVAGYEEAQEGGSTESLGYLVDKLTATPIR